MANKPLVSIIIPSFNKAQFLKESIDSAIKQDYLNTEIIVVNDGSTDNTSDLVKGMIRDNPLRRISLLEKTNGGISDARNYAIERAKGEFIMCLDGDDIALPSFASRAIELTEKENAGLVTCNVELFGAETSHWDPLGYDRYGIRYNNNIPTLVLYRKELWQKTGGYKRAFPFNEDWDFFINCSRHQLRVSRIPERLFRYRVTKDGLAQNFIKDSYNRSVALMVTSNSDLYPIDQALYAHSELAKMPQNWVDKIVAQDKLHPNEWLLKFWIGMLAESQRTYDVAVQFYNQAHQLAKGTQWQPLFRLGLILEKPNPKQALHALHIARLERPDLDRIVNEKIKTLIEQLGGAKPTENPQ